MHVSDQIIQSLSKKVLQYFLPETPRGQNTARCDSEGTNDHSVI